MPVDHCSSSNIHTSKLVVFMESMPDSYMLRVLCQEDLFGVPKANWDRWSAAGTCRGMCFGTSRLKRIAAHPTYHCKLFEPQTCVQQAPIYDVV